MRFLHIQEDSPKQEQIFEGMNFVITGSLVHFGNRSEAKELIESLGGKVTGSVTKEDQLSDQQRHPVQFIQKQKGQRTGDPDPFRRRFSETCRSAVKAVQTARYCGFKISA